MSDVKELTPEFFYCPDIFLNANKLPLGEMQVILHLRYYCSRYTYVFCVLLLASWLDEQQVE